MTLVMPGWDLVELVAVLRRGVSKKVSRKGPMWFVPNCDSRPSMVSRRSELVTAALLIRMSMCSTRVWISLAADLTEAWEERSTMTSFGVTPGHCSLICFAMVWSFDCVREASMRFAGTCFAIAIAVVPPRDSGETPVMTTSIGLGIGLAFY